jgi:hypothetical protein
MNTDEVKGNHDASGCGCAITQPRMLNPSFLGVFLPPGAS